MTNSFQELYSLWDFIFYIVPLRQKHKGTKPSRNVYKWNVLVLMDHKLADNNRSTLT